MSYTNYSSRRGGRPSRGQHFSAATTRRAPRSRGEYINPERFVKAAKPVVETEGYTAVNTFSDFKIHDLITQNLLLKNYAAPSAIQDQSIPLGLEGKDIIGVANTGTGKTLAFAIPVLNRLLSDERSKALIMAPTRELALQIEEEFRTIAKGSGIYGAVLIGGATMGTQLNELRHDPRIVIGTPGRIKDHMERGTLKLGGFNMVVLDEVDRMLDMGFINDIKTILHQLLPVRQSFFFSATVDPKVRLLMNSFMTDPVMVSVKTGDTSDFVEQSVITYGSSSEKLGKLHDVLIKEGVAKTLVFDETQRSVERLSKELQARGFQVDAIHGGKSQSQRQRALTKFRNNELTVLVATDVAARGIDVADITHVINYTTPQSYSDYVHRIGRAGRAGRAGHAMTFVAK
jgi:ATP-dependent RNA helicase RhlE